MMRYPWPILLFLVTGTLVLLGGCGDDECPVCPGDETATFEIAVSCVDESGQPLANVAVGAMSALPEAVWPFEPNRFLEKSRVGLGFELTETLRIKILIRDVERNRVTTIIEEYMDAGRGSTFWNGRYADSGIQTPAGYYEAVLLVDEGEGIGWAAVDSIGLFQAAFDVGQFSYGTTDAEGKIRLTDRRMVPAFYELLPIPWTDENATPLGLVPLTTTTWLNCQSQDGRSGWGIVDAIDGRQEITVTLVENAKAPEGLAARPLGAPTAGTKDARASFEMPYPNPFN